MSQTLENVAEYHLTMKTMVASESNMFDAKCLIVFNSDA